MDRPWHHRLLATFRTPGLGRRIRFRRPDRLNGAPPIR